MRFFSYLAPAFVLSIATPAFATAEFPGEINTQLGATSCGPPDCVICHLSDNGGLGTVQHPFGVAMRARGLSAYNDPALNAALTKMETDIDPNTCTAGIDSNCDGMVDTDELKACNWQALVTDMCGTNGADGGAAGSLCDAGVEQTENVLYGCTTSSSPTPTSGRRTDMTAFVVAGMVAAALVIKRRRKK